MFTAPRLLLPATSPALVLPLILMLAFFPVATAAAQPGCSQVSDFSVVVLPDTQYYSQSYAEIFEAQTQWVADKRNLYKIGFVVHEGDMVETWNDPG